MLLLTCPPDFYGTILQTPTIALAGNASIFVSGGTCGSINLVHSDVLPPSVFMKRNGILNMPNKINGTLAQVSIPMNGTLNGVMIHNFTDTGPVPMHHFGKRSVSAPYDWTEKIGDFSNAFMMNASNPILKNRMGYPSLETDTNGIFRYFTHIGLEMNQVVQHDYYNMSGNLHAFNPGQVFNQSSLCYIGNTWTNTSHYPRRMRYDGVTNRFVIFYIPLNSSDIATRLCVVISNSENMFFGGGYGFDIPLPFTARGPDRLDVGFLANTFQICFDAVGEAYAPFTGTYTTFTGAARYGNCVIIRRANIINGLPTVPICSIGAPGIQIGTSAYTNSTILPLHLPLGVGTLFDNSLFQPDVVQQNGINQYCNTYGSLCDANFATCVFGGGATGVVPTQIIGWNITVTNNTIDTGALSLQMSYSSPTGALVFAMTLNTNGSSSVIIIDANNQLHPLIKSTDANGSIFGATPLFLSDDTLVVAYQQFSFNISNQIPSTYFVYRLSSDAPNTFRTPKYNVQMNGLANPMQIPTNANLISAGICAPSGKYEFSIMGMGHLTSMIHQDFRIQGEQFTRTFTVSDNCGSANCTQNIYLNSTRELILTCPATYVGSITDGNGTYVSPSISGNATSYSGNPCGGVTLTYTDENPPSFVQQTKRDDSDVFTIITNITELPRPPIVGHLMGTLEFFDDLPMPVHNTKRSVTSPNNLGQQVGQFSTTFNVSTSNYQTNFNWLATVVTDGIIRYAVYNNNQSIAVLQHDYYNLLGNAHFFNPGQGFPVTSTCYPNGTQSGWIHDMIRDQNRFVFAYFNPANYSKLCLVISNTNDFFNGGAAFYELGITPGAYKVSNFNIGRVRETYNFCFDDINLNGTAAFGNCFIVQRTPILSGVASTLTCAVPTIGSLTTVSPLHFPDNVLINFVTNRSNAFVYKVGGVSSVSIFVRTIFSTADVSGFYDFSTCNNVFGSSGAFINNFDPYVYQTPVLLPGGVNSGGNLLSVDAYPVGAFSTDFAFAYVLTNNSANTVIMWGSTLTGVSVTTMFNPGPGLHVFGPNIRLLPNRAGIVMSYLQTSSNVSYQVPSTSYGYWLRTDPTGVLRVPSSLQMNGLSNPQTLTSVNGTNPTQAGLDVLSDKNEFTIFGPGNAQGGSWSFINQDFRIAGERFTRTFTLTDGCGSISCVQEIYLNSTRSLILTCPAPYYGTIYEGNGTYLSPAVTGNATTYIGSPCGAATLTFTTENPPTNNVQEFKRQIGIAETIIDPNATSVNLGPAIEGHMMGTIDVFMELPIPMMTENQTSQKRSVTSPRDWTQQVGNFGTTYNISSSYSSGFNWISSLETDGVLRYAVYNTNQSFAILQHDYYDITGNVHFFNPGQVFPNGSSCRVAPGTSTTGWQHDLKRDIKLNRYVFVYFNASVTNIMCLVISNTSDFFNGGAVGYEVMLTTNTSYFGSNQRLRFSVNQNMYSFCFDDFTQNVTNNDILEYIGPLYWGNCYALERERIVIAAASPRICPLQINAQSTSDFRGIRYSVETLHQTSNVFVASGFAGSASVIMPIVKFPATAIRSFSNNGNATYWDFSLPCVITSPSAFVPSQPRSTINYNLTNVPVLGGIFAKADPTRISVDVQDYQIQATAWTIVDTTQTTNTKIGWSLFGLFTLVPPYSGIDMNSTLDPFPGNYTHGVHVFAPTIKILPNRQGIVLAYEQSTLNPALSLPSTSYGYWIRGDPPGVLRPAEYPLNLNNLANPQRLTGTNLTNPLSTGLAVHPTKLEFSIFGPGDAASPNSWSFINQDFRIAGERWTRTFTLADACGSTSCVQEIYLNSTI